MLNLFYTYRAWLTALVLLPGVLVPGDLSSDQQSPDLSQPVLEGPQFRLEASYGVNEDRATVSAIASRMGEKAAQRYSDLTRQDKAEFIVQELRKESPLFFKYYYGYHLGQRLYTVSPAYFEHGNLIPRRYFSNFAAPHPDDIETARKWADAILANHPDDPIALCALGYLMLESDQIKEARTLFTRAISKRKKLVEARNGRALAYLKMNRKKAQALEHFRQTISMNRRYVGALYGMAMCHIALMGQDRVGLDDYFGKVVDADPDHPDAHYKLGVFNEALRRHDRAAESYSRQLAVNPDHNRASERLAQVSMVLKGTGNPHLSHHDLVRLAEKNPSTYLPLLADAHIERGEFAQADEAYARYISGLPAEEAHYYRDLSLIAPPESVSEIESAYPRQERQRLIRKFWVLADPTPTTTINERRIEHYRRTYHARTHYSDGIDRLSVRGWDQRGDVYIRFGKPDHQSWSDFLVFETDPEVAAVKNRINHLAHEGLDEVLPPRHTQTGVFQGGALVPVTTEIRGIPTFPLPRRTTETSDGVEAGYRWESWIYGSVGGGIEVTFIDEIGKGFYEFARTPQGSPNRLLWEALSPATVVGRITRHDASLYTHDYNGNPIDLFVTTAGFRAQGGRTDYEVYLGIPVTQILDTTSRTAVVNREIVFYDRDWKPSHRSVEQVSHSIVENDNLGTSLMIDQINADLHPGDYFMAIQIQQPETRAVQVFKTPITVTGFRRSTAPLDISDIEVASTVRSGVSGSGPFRKGGLTVVPLPTREVSSDRPVSLYFEIYNLARDAFGKTHYRVDYEIEADSNRLTIVSSLGRLIGQGSGNQGARIAYEHDGDTADEQMHVDLSVPPIDGTTIRITVRVTDLQSQTKPESDAREWTSAAKSIDLNLVRK